MKTIGFYPGSFDPFTNGHLQIVTKASKCFDKVIIGVCAKSYNYKWLNFCDKSVYRRLYYGKENPCNRWWEANCRYIGI